MGNGPVIRKPKDNRTPSDRAEDRAFAGILKGKTFEVSRIAESVRQLVRTAVPTLREQIMPGYARYFSGGNVVCAITVHSDHVNLQFFYATELSDPDHRLVGSGKRLRHIPLYQTKDIQPRYVTQLLKQAADRGASNPPMMSAVARNRKQYDS